MRPRLLGQRLDGSIADSLEGLVAIEVSTADVLWTEPAITRGSPAGGGIVSRIGGQPVARGEPA